MEWISVKEKLPLGDEYKQNTQRIARSVASYLCSIVEPDSKGGFVKLLEILTFDFSDNTWIGTEGIVTHWMPLPAMPGCSPL